MISNKLHRKALYFFLIILFCVFSPDISANENDKPILPKDGKNKNVILIWLYPEADFKFGGDYNDYNTKKSFYDDIKNEEKYKKLYKDAGYTLELMDFAHKLQHFDDAPSIYPNYCRKGNVKDFITAIKSEEFQNASIRAIFTHMFWGIVVFDQYGNKYFKHSDNPQSDPGWIAVEYYNYTVLPDKIDKIMEGFGFGKEGEGWFATSTPSLQWKSDKPNLSLDNNYTYAIYINVSYIDKIASNKSINLLCGCDSEGAEAKLRGENSVSISFKSTASKTETLFSNFTDYLLGISNKRYNYTTDEFYKEWKNIWDTSNVLSIAGDKKILLYKQPKIVSLIVKQAGNKIYNYIYEGINDANSDKPYPGNEAIKNAHLSNISNVKENLEVELKIEGKINISLIASALKKGEVGTTLRLYKDNIPEEGQIGKDYIIGKSISLKYSEDDNLSTVEYVYQLSDFLTPLQNNNKLILILKITDDYSKDSMFYLDTTGTGGEDGMSTLSINGSRVYYETDSNNKDGLDTYHWLQISPELHVENMEIDWLHVNPGNEALAVYNMQPLRSDGAVIFADSTFKDLYNCGADRYSKAYNECIDYRSNEIVADNISSDYYLNMEMLQTPPSAIASINSINDVLYKMYPVYIANIRSGSSLKSLVEDNSIKDFVKLYLDVTPYNTHTDRNGTNLPGADIRNVDVTDFYYTASWKDEDNAGRAMVILPLYRIFKEKPTKENGLPKLPDLPDGIYKIRVETTNGATGDDKMVFDSGTLRFFKDFNSPYESSTNSMRYVEDNSSGFDNQHFRMRHPSALNVYDMAHNKIKIAESHITNDKSIVKNFGSGYNPEILTIGAVADLSTPSGAALKSSWRDQDNNVIPKMTRVFLARADSLFTTTWKLSYDGTPLPEYKPADISYVREIDLTKDLDANNIRQDGFILKNCNDLYEGDYYIKVHVEDSTYRYDDEARNIKINIAKPVIDDIKIDLDNRLITAKISDIGTPIEMLKIEFEQPMAFQYLDNRSLIFQTRIPSGIDKMTLKVTDLAGNEVKQDFNWDMSKLPPEEPSEPSPDTPQGTDLPTQTTVITKPEINNVPGITTGVAPSEEGSGGAANITQVPIKQGGEEETEVNLESYPINRGGFYNLFDLFWENTSNGVTPEEQKLKFGQVILYYWFQAPRFADHDFSGYINIKYPEIKILIDPNNLKIDSVGFNQKEAGEVASQIRFHYKDSWVNLPVKELQSYETGKNSYLATFDLPEPLNEKISDPAVIFKMRGGEYIQEAVYEEKKPDGTTATYTWKPTYSNYPSLVYIDTPSLDNSVSTGLQFDVYDIDYVRTKFYINDEYIGNYSLIDQLNIKAKSCLAMGQSCETNIFGPIEDWWKMYEWGKWAEEFGGWQGTYFAAKSDGSSGVQRFIYTIYRVDKFISVFIRMVEDIFSTFFEAYSLPLRNTQLPPGAQPKIEKKVYVEYYKYQFETESRDSINLKYNYPILRNLYKPDYMVYEPPIPLPEGENTAKVVIYDYDGNQAVTKHKFEVIYTPRILSFGFNKNYSVDNGIYAFDAYIQDYGNDVQSSNISLLIDNKEYPWKTVDLQWDNNLYKGHVSFHPAASFPVGVHKAELIVTDQHGHTVSQAITFGIKKIEFKLDEIIARDIEGNGDGNLNEGERVYLDLGLLNQGDQPAYEVSAELLNRSRYIKGVPEPLSAYGMISSKTKAFNLKSFEFVINDNIFASEDIDTVSAEFTLVIKYKTALDQETFTAAEFPFTLTIIRLDPTFSEFSLFVDRSVTETFDPNFTVKGSWLSSGCFLKELSAEQLDGTGTQLIISRDDLSKTYSANAVLHVGENKFLVTATTDSGLSRTAEVSVKLLSQVGIKLDTIADTKDPNVTITGEAWTVNSKLESVKIYVNGGLIGDAIIDSSGGRFSLPVTLNGGENIIRAVAHDDYGKSASDEIKINMHGPLTLRWQRAHWRTTETPVTACGSYEVEGNDIASIATYVNNTPNTYEVVIDRNLKTFCTTADLQSGSNLLRAVGTTTGGVTADAYSRIEYGGLTITLDSMPAYTASISQTVSGHYTLSTDDPFTIDIYIQEPSGGGWASYSPTIDPNARTFSVDVSLFDRFAWCSDILEDCGCQDENQIIAIINQGSSSEYDERYITLGQPVINNGVESYDPDLCDPVYSPEGWIEGSFAVADPSVHVTGIVIHTENSEGHRYYTVIDWSEITGRFRFEFTDFSGWYWQVLINATDGNTYGCRGNNCIGAVKPPNKESKKKNDPKRIKRSIDKEQRRKIKDKD